VYEDEELEPEVLTYREYHRQLTLGEWHERRRQYECGGERETQQGGTGSLTFLRHLVGAWAVELASRNSGRPLFRRPA
jgi:hypothetical protein